MMAKRAAFGWLLVTLLPATACAAQPLGTYKGAGWQSCFVDSLLTLNGPIYGTYKFKSDGTGTFQQQATYVFDYDGAEQYTVLLLDYGGKFVLSDIGSVPPQPILLANNVSGNASGNGPGLPISGPFQTNLEIPYYQAGKNLVIFSPNPMSGPVGEACTFSITLAPVG
jgi:hypothetical protein